MDYQNDALSVGVTFVGQIQIKYESGKSICIDRYGRAIGKHSVHVVQIGSNEVRELEYVDNADPSEVMRILAKYLRLAISQKHSEE